MLETIRQSDLDRLQSPNDLIKHIASQIVTFPDKFKWAGLDEHVLDIFEGEVASEVCEWPPSYC